VSIVERQCDTRRQCDTSDELALSCARRAHDKLVRQAHARFALDELA